MEKIKNKKTISTEDKYYPQVETISDRQLNNCFKYRPTSEDKEVKRLLNQIGF